MATLETQKPRNYLKLADLRFFLKRKCVLRRVRGFAAIFSTKGRQDRWDRRTV
jgi:hypothetical protein